MNNTGAGSGGPFHIIKTLYGSTTQFTVTNLAEETTYHFVVAAFDDIFSNSTYSNVVSATTLDVTAPVAPTGLTATAEQNVTITLKWESNDEPDLVGYLIYMNKSGSGSNFNLIHTMILTKTTNYNYYHVKHLTEKTKYYFKIQAFDEVPNNSPYSSTVNAVTADGTKPGAPTGLDVTDHTIDTLKISWDPNPESDVAGYILYRGLSESVITENLNSIHLSSELITNTEFTDKSLSEGTTYYYQAQAVDESGKKSDRSEVAFGTTLKKQNSPYVDSSYPTYFTIPEDTYVDNAINLYELFIDPDDDPLTFSSSGQENINVTIYSTNGTVVIQPKHNWNGEEKLRFYASDGNFPDVNAEVTITVIPVNDPPENVKITKPENGDTIKEGEEVSFTGECYDADLPYDTLQYRWFLDDSLLGTGEDFGPVKLKLGEHTITLEVMDSQGTIAKTSITVYVTISTDPYKPPTNGDGGDDDDDGNKSSESDDDKGSSAASIGAAIAAVIIVIVLLLFLIKRREARGERREGGQVGPQGDKPTPPPPFPQQPPQTPPPPVPQQPPQRPPIQPYQSPPPPTPPQV